MDRWCDVNCPVGNCPASHCICDGEATTNAPTSGAPVTTQPVTTEAEDPAAVKGYYSWSWTGGDVGPAGSNASAFFSGWDNVTSALQEFSGHPALQGEKYFTIGGGNHNGDFTASVLTQFIQDIPDVKAKDFDAVMFDIEIVQGSAATMVPLFQQAFSAVQAAGMKVGITVSHSAPYSTDTPQDAADLVKAFVKDTNVNLMSPQLYSSGTETSPDFAVTSSCAAVCGWDLYQDMHAAMKFVPSLAYANQYPAVEAHFAASGITTRGYFQWAQTGSRTLIV